MLLTRSFAISCIAVLLTTSRLWAESPPDIVEFFGTAAGALAESEPATFLDHFDPALPNYADFRDEIESLLAANDVTSVVEIVGDDEAAPTRSIDLDWVLTAGEKGAANGTSVTRRAVVKCKIERRGKGWKIVALEPKDFFKF